MKVVRPTLALLLLLFSASGRSDEDPGFELVRGGPASIKVRQSVALSLSIVPHTGHRLLASGPVMVRLVGDGLRPQRPLYRRDEAVDPRADVPRFELQVTAERPGPARLDADCTFYLCRGELCRPVEARATWTVDVTP